MLTRLDTDTFQSVPRCCSHASVCIMPCMQLLVGIIARVMQWRSQSSGDGGEISHGRAPWSSGPLPEMITSRVSPTLLSRGPSGAKLGPLQPRMGPLRLWIEPCRPDMGPPKRVNCLFSLNFDSERSQYLVVRIENGPPESERGVKFRPPIF